MINAVVLVVLVEGEIALVHFAVPLYAAMVHPVAVGNRKICLVYACDHNGVMSAVTDKVAYLDLAEIIMTLPVIGMNAEKIVAQLDGKAVALACPVKIIAALVLMTVGTGDIGVSVGIVLVGRGLIPVFAFREFLAQHVEPCADVDGVLAVVSIAQVDPACRSLVSDLAELTVDRSRVE